MDKSIIKGETMKQEDNETEDNETYRKAIIHG